MKVKQFMTSNVQCCQKSDTIQRAAQWMASINCGSLPVCQGKKVIGVITDRDITLRAVAKGDWQASVGDCMSSDVVTCTPDTDAHEAADLMAAHQVRRLPVVNAEGDLCGMCAIGDLATIDIHINEAGDALSRISECGQAAGVH